ncbi:hypothetical protein B0T10DRAFT_37518 [Thelonectria olida]|uniref:Uncharacterized protein n=1 Tax=Thelonectria olida TaxID=1576542 RepID=A0A9P8WN58_9HYPO|nr:hypothetical protein B0T10DRAFT_37518 [Thelonectria olida]
MGTKCEYEVQKDLRKSGSVSGGGGIHEVSALGEDGAAGTSTPNAHTVRHTNRNRAGLSVLSPRMSFYLVPSRNRPRLTRASQKGPSVGGVGGPKCRPGTRCGPRPNGDRRLSLILRAGGRETKCSSRAGGGGERRGTQRNVVAVTWNALSSARMSRVLATWQPGWHVEETRFSQAVTRDVARKLPHARLQAHFRQGLEAVRRVPACPLGPGRFV